MSPWEETGDPERKALSSCLGWSPVVWEMLVEGLRASNDKVGVFNGDRFALRRFGDC